MRVIKNKGLIIVLSDPTKPGSQCPTLNLRGNSVVLRDDYHGKVRFKGNVLDAISKL